MDRTFDWRPRFDPRSRRYRAGVEDVELRNREWDLRPALDQGRQGACVGFACTHGLLAPPISQRIIPRRRARYARRVYRRAQRIDEWPGVAYSGTSVLAGCKVLLRAGVVERYEWAFGVDEVLAVLSQRGPVVLGIDWTKGMETPKRKGAATWIRATGSVVGGHAILANAVNVDREAVRLHNSWGPGWGERGEALLSWDDLRRVLSSGEAAILAPPS